MEMEKLSHNKEIYHGTCPLD